jgi:hypothetical protein
VGKDLFNEKLVFVIVKSGFKLPNPPTGRRVHPVQNFNNNPVRVTVKVRVRVGVKVGIRVRVRG